MIVRAIEAGLAPPEFRHSAGQVVQVLWRPTVQVATHVASILQAAGRQASKSAALQKAIGLKGLEHFRRRFRTPLVKAQWLAMSDPNSPNCPQQLYALTSGASCLCEP